PGDQVMPASSGDFRADPTTGAAPARDRLARLLVLAFAAVLLLVNLATPHELQYSDQGKQAQYVLDVLLNGHWTAPADLAIGESATKPPLYTWLPPGLAPHPGPAHQR